MDDSSLRVSDDDRERAIHALREHLIAGRLTLEEFSERAGAALEARVGAELERVQHDLPQPAAQPPGSRRKPARFTAALFSRVVRRGQLRLRGRSAAVSAFGDLDLDLREASIDQPNTVVTVVAIAGNADIYVPDGVSVNVTGLSVLGHRRDWGRDPGRSDAPAITVRVIGLAGTVDIWRVPRDLRGSSYLDIVHRLEGRETADNQRQLPG